MLAWPRDRKVQEAIVLAGLSIAAVVALRYPIESRVWLLAELAVIAATFTLGLLKKVPVANWLIRLGIVMVPAVFAVASRLSDAPIAYEMTIMTTLGAAALGLATGGGRLRAMSLVASGFLTLFAVAISDHPGALGFALAWMSVCVWHLVANHWEKLEVCMPDEVRRNFGIRPASVLAAVVLCVLGGWVVKDRFGNSNRLAFGVMPTSGGSKWSDPAARSGVGTGDAAIAAKDHAESFGAVDSDIFLESTESSLFDMFNDMIGEPKKKATWERRQAMGSENVIPTHERASQSERGGGSFSTDRMRPKQHQHLDNKMETAVVQWDGPTGIRLAMQRYDTFDGVDWTNTADQGCEKLNRQKIDQAVWMFDPRFHRRALEGDDEISVNLVKVLRLDSTRIPAPMMTAGVHVKDIDRRDFFGIQNDGSLFMPGREKVPSLTVFHLASLHIWEDELWEGLADAAPNDKNRPANSGVIKLDSPDADDLREYVDSLTAEHQHPYAQLRAVVSHLRDHFVFDRTTAGSVSEETTAASQTPLSRFFQSRRGSDELFATAAALMARELGLESRIVTGFYVRPDSFDITAGHANVQPRDVHVWTEVKLDDDRWFEIEPTPGYLPPVYQPSLWLRSQRFAAANWPVALVVGLVLICLHVTRLIWIEWVFALAWQLSRPVAGQRQVQLAMRILEWRGRMIGQPRPMGKPQRDWLELLVANDTHGSERIKRFCDVADGVVFGGQKHVDRRKLGDVVAYLKINQMKSIHQQVAT